MEWANEDHGEHRASSEAGRGAHWGREAVEHDPDRIDGDVIAEGRGTSRLTERQRRLNFFFVAAQSGLFLFFVFRSCRFVRVRVRTTTRIYVRRNVYDVFHLPQLC